jgi:excinuclease ABC subunit C
MTREIQAHTLESLEDLPKKPGVYIFKGRRSPEARSSVLYVGKAKSLYQRVRQYFKGEGDGRPLVQFLKTRVEEIETIVTESEQDALLLENELIKKHRPAYNIHLKDDKRYLSLRLDVSHEWPRLEVVRKIKKDKAVYLGPFSSATRLRSALEFIQKVFPLRSCDDRKLYNRSRPCIEYEIKRCVAPCVKFITPSDYRKLVDATILFLRGENKPLLQSLETQMNDAAQNERYEEAASLRDRLQSIESVIAGQGIIGVRQYQQGLDQDAVGISIEGSRAVIVVLFIRNGVIFDKRSFEFKNVSLEKSDLLGEFLNRYYSSDVYIPHEVLVSETVDVDVDIKVVAPRSEEKLSFVKVAEENADLNLKSQIQKVARLDKTLQSLQRLLGLTKLPQSMDCLDISHHQGKEAVASVVRFVDGMPFKDGYRRIKLQHDQVDDFESMREAMTRRYKEEGDLPDLIVIDGGKGQLGSAVEALKERGFLEKVEIVSLAKAREGSGIDPLNPQNRERVFRWGQKNPILFKEDSAEELLLRYLRDEAHRFAISYHRLRKDRMTISVLDELPGMTEKLKLKLLREFGSVDGILSAPIQDLAKIVKGKTLEALQKLL